MSFPKLEAYIKKLPLKSEQLVKELTIYGGRFAEKKLSQAETSSPVETQAFIERNLVGKKEGEITLVGTTKGGAGFVEFGTGTHYTSMAEIHPKAFEFGANRGEFGELKGADPPWWFMGQAGVTGEQYKNGFVKTFGQPANRVLYNTSKELQRMYVDIAKEVFNND